MRRVRGCDGWSSGQVFAIISTNKRNSVGDIVTRLEMAYNKGKIYIKVNLTGVVGEKFKCTRMSVYLIPAGAGTGSKRLTVSVGCA